MRQVFRKVFWFLLCSLALCPVGQAQASYHFRHFGPEDGAPSSKIYDFAQDSEGVIWIGTDQGLSAYDGTRFRTYTAADGLPNSMIISLEADAQDRLWVTTMSQPVVCFAGGKAYPLEGIENYRSIGLNTYYTAGDHTLWLQMIADGKRPYEAPLSYVDRDKRFHTVPNTKSNQFGPPVARADTSVFLYGPGQEVIHIYRGKLVKRIPHQANQELQFCKSWNQSILCMRPEKQSYLGGDTYDLISVDPHNGKVSSVFTQFSEYFANDNLRTFFVDHADNVWLCLRNGLLLLQKNEAGEYQAVRLLEGVSVNSIYQDRQLNYWLGTNGDGVYFLPSLQVQYWQRSASLGRGSIMAISGEKNGEIWIGYVTGYLEQLQSDMSIGYSQKIAARRIVDILPRDTKKWIISDKNLFSLSNENVLQKHLSVKESLKRLHFMRDSLYLFSKSIFKFHDGGLQMLYATEDDRIYAAAGKKEHLLLGTTYGLFTYSLGEESSYRQLAKNIRTNIKEIIWLDDNTYGVATQGFGLLMIANDTIQDNIRETHGLASDICNDLLLTDDYLWVATNKGISRINRSSGEIHNFSTKDGLSSNEINFVTQAGNKIVAATSSGLNIFADDIKPNRDAPLLHFKKLSINNQLRTLSDTLHLTHWENAIQLEYIGLAFPSTTPIQYAYQMDGLDQGWLYTTATSLNWSGLPPGSYRLRLKSRGNHTAWSKEQNILVSIAYPWWQRTWFYFGAGMLLLLLFGGILLAIQYQHHRERQQMHWQLTALRAQMNPHFMFNILNSVQDFIYQNDKFSASQYLAKFAGLMRGILHESTKEEISLQTEIKQLKLYLALEKLRFKDNFSYRIICEEEVLPEEVIIPSMLIQPFVENAIKHGLFHLEGEKQLKISFHYLSDQLLKCVIDDNGIGRTASKLIRKKQNILSNDKATFLTQKRLKVLTNLQRRRFSLRIEDKMKPSSGESLGTRVILHIPYKTF